jgi:hypothetical protein
MTKVTLHGVANRPCHYRSVDPLRLRVRSWAQVLTANRERPHEVKSWGRPSTNSPPESLSLDS